MNIRQTAINLAREHGLINITRNGLCAAAGIPDGSFSHVTGMSFAAFIRDLRDDPALVGLPPSAVTKTRTNPELRRDHILASAVQAATETGYDRITRRQVAEVAGVSDALVTRYFSTMNQLRRSIIRYAIAHRNLVILAQGIAARDPHALRAPKEVRDLITAGE